jgi:hypothetical protein
MTDVAVQIEREAVAIRLRALITAHKAFKREREEWLAIGRRCRRRDVRFDRSLTKIIAELDRKLAEIVAEIRSVGDRLQLLAAACDAPPRPLSRVNFFAVSKILTGDR